MKNVRFENQPIHFTARHNTTICKALNECIEFLKSENIQECDLDYNGFSMNLEKNSDLNEKIREYSEWIKYNLR